MKKVFLKSTLLLCALIVGSLSVWAINVTATLSGSDMIIGSKPGTSYTDYLTTAAPDDLGHGYIGRWTYQKNGGYLNMLQLKKPESSNSSRIQLPTFEGIIKTITITGTNASATSASGTGASTTLVIVSGTTYTSTYIKNTSNQVLSVGSSSTATKSFVFDFTTLGTSYNGTNLFISPLDAAIRIWSIEVVYEPKAAVAPSAETGKHYATFNAPYKVQLPSKDKDNNDISLTAYIGTYSDDEVTLHAFNGSVIPANTPIVIKSSSAAQFEITATSADPSSIQDGTDLSDNNLHGTLAATTAPANAYVLGYNSAADQETGFYQYSGTIPANRAYLIISGGAAQAAGIRIIESENNATDIQSTEANEKAVKFIQNGQILILRDGITYDALGRIVK